MYRLTDITTFFIWYAFADLLYPSYYELSAMVWLCLSQRNTVYPYTHAASQLIIYASPMGLFVYPSSNNRQHTLINEARQRNYETDK